VRLFQVINPYSTERQGETDRHR